MGFNSAFKGLKNTAFKIASNQHAFDQLNYPYPCVTVTVRMISSFLPRNINGLIFLIKKERVCC